jgi:hypothetical protein
MVFGVGPACLGIGIGHAFAGFPAIAHVDGRCAAVVDNWFRETRRLACLHSGTLAVALRS